MSGKHVKIITIDGPAGAGKSTLAKTLASRLGWIYLDTGALYRAAAVAAAQAGVDVGDQCACEILIKDLQMEVRPLTGGTFIYINGQDVTGLLRSPEISQKASCMSKWPGVRAALLGLQRDIGHKGEVVVEGRDMGTVVFPDAGLKFFLSASPEARARRRYDELLAKGDPMAYELVLEQMVERDKNDTQRASAPLKAAPEAVVIDSTSLDIDGVLESMLVEVKKIFEKV